MKSLIKYSAMVALLGSTNIAMASSHVTAKIVQILSGPNYGNNIIIKIDKTPTVSGCHTNQSYNYVFDGTTEQGQMYLSLVLSAHMAGRSVSIAGYGNRCNNYNGVEDLYHLIVK